LGDLAVEGRLPDRTEPGDKVGFKLTVGDVATYRASNVSPQDRAVQISGTPANAAW
jgi:hypothetical protein